jgi:hypothetical protein
MRQSTKVDTVSLGEAGFDPEIIHLREFVAD